MAWKELNYKYAVIVAANQRDLRGLVWESFREVRLRSGSTRPQRQFCSRWRPSLLAAGRTFAPALAPENRHSRRRERHA